MMPALGDRSVSREEIAEMKRLILLKEKEVGYQTWTRRLM